MECACGKADDFAEAITAVLRAEVRDGLCPDCALQVLVGFIRGTLLAGFPAEDRAFVTHQVIEAIGSGSHAGGIH